MLKTYGFPIWLIDLRNVPDEKSKPQKTLFAEALMPSLRAVRKAEGRINQRIGLLRHVEALRLYAADHGGNVPAKLADAGVLLPVDPFSGKPFRYEVVGQTAHLRGTPPPGDEKLPPFNIHYEITFSK